MKTVLTIAGSDCSGGAGIQADIKTITSHKLYAMSAITALTAQNTMGVFAIMEVSPEFLGQQLDAIFQDIPPDAVKIGMVANSQLIEVIEERLIYYKAKNIVVDPVMISTSGGKLLSDDAMNSLITRLLPLGTIITPNIPEGEALWGQPINSQEDMILAAEFIQKQTQNAVLLKGGHLKNSSNDLLLNKDGLLWYTSIKIKNTNTHGTGCTLSSAIACNLATGYSLEESVRKAKEYITGALNAQLNLGTGSGPLNHMF
jgi:hydroxymethylpyrimidine/phosphomethylpyrimidine kinase